MTRGEKRAAYQKAYRVAHAAERAAYYAAHREATLAKARACYALQREADRARNRAWYRANHLRKRATQKARYNAVPPEVRKGRTKRNNAKYAEARRVWDERNKESQALKAAARAKANPHLKRAATARRLAAKRRAMPGWADLAAIQTVYQAAARLTKATGVRHEVDHVVPLKSDIVCGLHVADNLRVITKSENCRKSNKHSAHA